MVRLNRRILLDEKDEFSGHAMDDLLASCWKEMSGGRMRRTLRLDCPMLHLYHQTWPQTHHKLAI